jgi:hypothetical protein
LLGGEESHDSQDFVMDENRHALNGTFQGAHAVVRWNITELTKKLTDVGVANARGTAAEDTE